jgi:uncharacterized cupredoxin-like copper-binding protein
VLALSTGHEVGLAVTAGVFILFALASSFLFPQFRPNYPGRGLPAFIVVCFVFFVGMLTAVERFGAEGGESEAAVETTAETTTAPPPPTTTEQETTTTTAEETTTTAPTTTEAKPEAQTVQVSETEFKIALPSTDLKAGTITFDVKNDGKIPHDLAVKETGDKTPLIQPDGSAKLTVDLKPGTYELLCTVPGHEAAGMKTSITVT